MHRNNVMHRRATRMHRNNVMHQFSTAEVVRICIVGDACFGDGSDMLEMQHVMPM